MGRRKNIVEDKTEIVLEKSSAKEEYNPDTDPDLKLTPSKNFDNNCSAFKVKYKLPKAEKVVETITIGEEKYIVARNLDTYLLYSVGENSVLNKICKSTNPMTLRENYIVPIIEKTKKKKKESR